LRDKQINVLAGMAMGLMATLISIGLAVFGVLEPIVPPANIYEPLMDAVRWDALVVGCLAANIAMIASHRFITEADIDGGGLSVGTPRVRVLQAILQNTLEQAVLALGVHAVWASTMPPTLHAVVPVASLPAASCFGADMLEAQLGAHLASL
jgi:hypothetical protein